jgi:hypothetical protein
LCDEEEEGIEHWGVEGCTYFWEAASLAKVVLIFFRASRARTTLSCRSASIIPHSLVTAINVFYRLSLFFTSFLLPLRKQSNSGLKQFPKVLKKNCLFLQLAEQIANFFFLLSSIELPHT